ncbi:MAG: DEAD/DEAH box helicase [Thaumarchaeota archaeon]|nr:DEAD/DEAH box helicase [Nitrososphaerota archaeon]
MKDENIWIEHKLIKVGSVEKRDYQILLAKTAVETNTLIVLPTGLGKTTIALLIIAEILTKTKDRCLFLAPTRVLVQQHYTYLQNFLDVLDISMITGESAQRERTRIWDNSIICATPQITLNDLKRGIIKPNDFSLVIFDEAHRAIGNYAYCGIANLIKEYNPRIVGMTATIPSEKEKANEIVNNIGIKKISMKDETSDDVRPYIKETNVEWIQVELPAVMKQIRSHIVATLESRTRELVQKGAIRSIKATRSELIRAMGFVRVNRGAAKALYTAIRISHALNSLDTQGITSFLRFLQRLEAKSGIGIKELFLDPNFKTAYELAKNAESNGVEHPKIEKLKDILSGVEGKILIFTSYRDSVEVIHNKLRSIGYSVGYLIGKAGERGLKQGEQIDTVNKFRDGRYSILVATQVGEEGLDISECNLVVFYDNVPSSIRFVQRKGRTGRKAAGRVVVLMTKDTLDEAYYWISKRKMRESKNMARKMNGMIEKEKPSLDKFMNG